MKYKLLLNGKNSNQIKDFFQGTQSSFDCMSTSSIWEDMTAHISLFRPDGFLFFIDKSDDTLLSQLKQIRSRADYRNLFIIACESAECDDLKKKLLEMNALVIPKSSPQLMEREIKRYFVTNPPEKPDVKPAGGSDDLGLGMSLGDLMKSLSDLPSRKHILVVDDDKGVLKMLKMALSDDYDVTTMVNGKMAEKFLETKNADLILLDYEMPEETGPEVLKHLRENPKSAKIPVVFLTGVAEAEKIKDVLALKPQGYLLKPIDMERLRTTIEGVFKQ